jgi:hypothetical protein
MEPSTYSVFADMLAKFQFSPEWIKALWLVTLAAMVVGVSWNVAGVLKALIAAVAPRRAGAPLMDAARRRCRRALARLPGWRALADAPAGAVPVVRERRLVIPGPRSGARDP